LVVSRSETAGARLALLFLVLAVTPAFSLDAQEAELRLNGSAYVGDTALTDGIVVLHHLSNGEQGGLDSLSLSSGGAFTFTLPEVPDPVGRDVFFASIRHLGVLYFGPAITDVAQLDSTYEIHTYDTILAPAAGMALPIQSRSVFFEPDTVGWRVTDLFQLRNDEARTVVTRTGGIVWSHLLPAEATDVTAGEGEIAFDAAEYEDGRLVVRAAIPPGERLFVVRYHVDSPIISIPNQGLAEALDVLIREPAPSIEVEGLERIDPIELEPGSTYSRYAGTDVTAGAVNIVETEGPATPPVQWAALVLAMILAGSGMLVLRSGPATAKEAPRSRQSLLLEVATLDEAFVTSSPTVEERRVYERRRAELLRNLRDDA
jgi:hypothetical protein